MKHTARPLTFQPALLPDQQFTIVCTLGNRVYARARLHDGAPVYVEQKYLPTYYLPCAPHLATHQAVDGMALVSHQPGSIHDARQWIDKSRAPVYGNIQTEYMMLSDAYGTRTVAWDIDRLYIWKIDIEVDSEAGFAKPDDPFAEVTAITVMWTHMGQSGTVVYGRGDYAVKGDELYLKCPTEEDLLLRFLEDLRGGGDYPDILTGWNIGFYDIPYLVNRCKRLFTEKIWERISPFNRLADRTVVKMGKSQKVVDIKGIAILDGQELYQKFVLTPQESYRLDHIAHAELGKRKQSYKEYQSLRRLYRENHQLFIEYNIQDVVLVHELDAKLKLIELVCALAYDAKCNFADCFKQVRLWDIMIYHKLRADGYEIPPRKDVSKSEKYAGAYVKETLPGMYPWVCSFDVASMYPHIIRQWNLSPETKVDQMVGALVTRDKPEDEVTAVVDTLLACELDTTDIHQRDYCLAANGVLTERDREGFLPAMMKTLYEERSRYKKLQKQAENVLEHETDPAKQKDLVKNIAAYTNQQKVRKINLNSAYGAMGSAYFRFFDVDLAEAVTVTGQMIIRWVAKDINTYLNGLFKTDKDYIIASDTDSVYIDMGRVVEVMGAVEKDHIVRALNAFCDQKIQPLINKTFEDIAAYLNVATPCLTMIRDVIADNCIWTAPKHYLMNVYDSEGNRYEKPKLKVTGLQMVQSSTPNIVRTMFKKAFTIIVSSGKEEDLWAFISQCEDEFTKAGFEDIAKPSSVNGLKKYAGQIKGVPMHVAAALTFNRLLAERGLLDRYEPIREGEKIKTAYLLEPNPFGSHVIAAPHGCPEELEVEPWLNRDLQFKKTFLDPLDGILQCAGWTLKRQCSVWD